MKSSLLPEREKLNRICEVLQAALPTRNKVVLRVRPLASDGTCRSEKRRHFICVNKRLPYTTQCDTLLHEYAHALTAEEGGSIEHTNNWGRHFARVYRAYLAGWIHNDDALTPRFSAAKFRARKKTASRQG